MIRGVSVSCDVDVPEPPTGRDFDKEKVSVSYRESAGQVALTYDPSCEADDAWHYDDPAHPRQIRLCPAVCEAVQGFGTEAEIEVNLECEQQILL